MNLLNLPGETGLPLCEFYRGNERYRLTLRLYRETFVCRLERWLERGKERLWTFQAREGLSLNPDQARRLMRGLELGLAIIENDEWSSGHSRVVRW
jgi:hypothetical protein